MAHRRGRVADQNDHRLVAKPANTFSRSLIRLAYDFEQIVQLPLKRIFMSAHLIKPRDFSRRGTYSPRNGCPGYMSATLRARPEIIESTSDRVNIEFTTVFSYHIWWW